MRHDCILLIFSFPTLKNIPGEYTVEKKSLRETDEPILFGTLAPRDMIRTADQNPEKIEDYRGMIS